MLTPIAQWLDQLRQGQPLPLEALRPLATALADGSMTDAQAGALAMGICWRGLSDEATTAWTLAMRDSGTVLRWADLPGPTVDKHSTGGLGDTVSLILGPLLAACGAYVPMISGRGLGHTGGTLDKIEAWRGCQTHVEASTLQRIVREVGVAIVSANAQMAPADRRLYAVRDVSGTVACEPLIVSSILAKKLAAGLGALVMDVKYGNGAFLPGEREARGLAQALVRVGSAAGLRTRAWLTPMDQALAPCAGNALEAKLAVDVLTGRVQPLRLLEVIWCLGAEALVAVGLSADTHAARAQLQRALSDGRGAERLAKMVGLLGGPSDVLERNDAGVETAPVQQAVLVAPNAQSLRSGVGSVVTSIDVQRLGWAVVSLGGGRRREADRIDPRVGLTHLASLGQTLEAGAPLAVVHAADEASAELAAREVRAAYRLAPASSVDGSTPTVHALTLQPLAEQPEL